MNLQDIISQVTPNTCYVKNTRHYQGINGYGIDQDIQEVSEYLFNMYEKYGDTPINYVEIGAFVSGLPRIVSEIFTIDNMVIIDDGQAQKSTHHRMCGTNLEQNKTVLDIYNDNINNIRCNKLHLYVGDSHSDKCEQFLQDLNLTYE